MPKSFVFKNSYQDNFFLVLFLQVFLLYNKCVQCFREQRVTGVAIFLMIGLSVLLTSVLKVSGQHNTLIEGLSGRL